MTHTFSSASRGCLLTMVVWSVLGLLASSRGAEISPKGPVPRDSLITVQHNGSAFVVGLVNGKFTSVPTHECPGATVFVGPPGSYLVIVLEGDQRFQSVVDVVDGNPAPPPPPPPPPTPPTPPVPDTVERVLGIGPTAYLLAVQTGAATVDIQRLASSYRQASVYLHELRLTPEGAQEQLRNVRKSIGGNWAAWEQGVEPLISAALTKYGTGQFVWRDCCREIASALEAAAAARTGVRK